jgi:hypothetical protein
MILTKSRIFAHDSAGQTPWLASMLRCLRQYGPATPVLPPSAPATGSSNGFHRESDFLAMNSLPFGEAFLRGIFCNILVILGLIMSYFSKDVISKIVCVMLPIMTFVASGFEHCVANMYLIPAGHFAKGLGFADLTVMSHNILPATLGNILGGLFINPHFPAYRSGHRLFQRPSPRKQIPSIKTALLGRR